MNPFRIVLALAALFIFSAPGFSAVPETLKLPDLINRPDRLPASVMLNRDFDFNGGKSAKKGQTVQVLEFNGAQVLVNAGEGLIFDIQPAESDLLEAANKTWASLAPEQRALDVATLMKDSSLWPDQVKCMAGFSLQGGGEIAPGGEFDLISITNEGVHLYSREHSANLQADLAATDTLLRARERVLIAPDKRPSRVATALREVLVTSDGKPFNADSLEKVEIFALYYGASWCGPCRKFSPDLVKYFNEVAEKNPKLLVILMSNDKRDADMLSYMNEEKMPWPALPLANLQKTPLFTSYMGTGIPQLTIVDRYGKVLASNWLNQQYSNPRQTLAQLTKLVDEGKAR